MHSSRSPAVFATWVSALYVRMVTRWKTTFYVYLAAIFSLLVVIDAGLSPCHGQHAPAAFDTMVYYRIIVQNPDKDIVIVDINEASLAAMAKEYGRWPWPRQVLGEFLEHLEEQRRRRWFSTFCSATRMSTTPIATCILPPLCPGRPTRSFPCCAWTKRAIR